MAPPSRFGLNLQSSVFLFSFIVYQTIRTSLPLLSFFLPSCSVCMLYVTTPFVYLWLCAYVSSLCSYSSGGKGNNVAVTSVYVPCLPCLVSLSFLFLSLPSHKLLKFHVFLNCHSSCFVLIIFRARVSLEIIRMNFFGMTKSDAYPASKLIPASLATSLVHLM